jgi:hypothetical protein
MKPNGDYEAAARGRCAVRFVFVIAAMAVLLVMRSVDPESVGKWLPLRMSCGAITGLPCIFCGMTRAFHALLNGDVSGTIYFNWLAFPFLGLLVFLILVFAIEITKQRAILTWRAVGPITGRKLTIIGFGLFFLWALQVYLAVSQHKHELLNPRGPLYALFVR